MFILRIRKVLRLPIILISVIVIVFHTKSISSQIHNIIDISTIALIISYLVQQFSICQHWCISFHPLLSHVRRLTLSHGRATATARENVIHGVLLCFIDDATTVHLCHMDSRLVLLRFLGCLPLSLPVLRAQPLDVSTLARHSRYPTLLRLGKIGILAELLLALDTVTSMADAANKSEKAG